MTPDMLSRSLWSYAKEALWPRDAFGRVLLVLVVIRTPIVWLTSMLVRGEPLVVTTLYRPGGDIQYIELVSSMGRGNLGESQLYESLHQGFQGFPLGSMWLHAGLFAVGKLWGLFAADIVVTVLGYTTYATLARVVALGPNAARGLAGGITAFLYVVLTPLTDRLGWPQDLVWGERFPRPFLTEIYVALAVTLLLSLHLQPREGAPRLGRGFWIFAGLVFSLLVQSDIYSAFIIALAAVLVLGRMAIGWREGRAEALRGIGLMVVVIAATAWPFALQRRGMLPEVSRRWGAYPISRRTAIEWASQAPISGAIAAAVVAILVWLVARSLLPNAPEDERVRRQRVVIFFAVLPALAPIAMPLFYFAVGQGLFPYHFVDRARRFAMLAIVLLGAEGAAVVVHRLRIASHRWVRAAAGVALSAAMLTAFAVRARAVLHREEHGRSFYRASAGAKYRSAFAELMRELERPRYASAVVLGTLDQQVQAGWHLLGGRSFVPDGWLSTCPDAELERRLVLFARLIGMPTEPFLSLLEEGSYQSLIFNSKYQTNASFAFGPPEDYTPEQRTRINARSIFVAFGYEMPISETARFRELYEGDAFRADEPPRLDVVVLTRDARFADLSPPGDQFELAFENELFRVYDRRK